MILQVGIALSDALSILSNLLAPLLGAFFAVIVWLHKRIQLLEEKQGEQRASLYGAENDALNEGLTKEVRIHKEDLTDLRATVDELQSSINDLRKHMDEKESE